jgi:hypothetical protein
MDKDLYEGRRWISSKGPQGPDQCASSMTTKQFVKSSTGIFNQILKEKK